MTEAIKILTLIDMIFVILLAISGPIGGVWGEIMYSYAVFVIPLLIGGYASLKLRTKREEEAGVAEEYKNLFTLDADRAKRLLPLIAPSVAIVCSVSVLTSLLISAFGASAPAVEDKGLVAMLFAHALKPAIFEEAVFRFLPMLILAPYSKRACVFYSALCFALIHCSLWQMPYAFIAGLVFMAVDLALESVWPSMILHFINNAASVVVMKYCHTLEATWIFVFVLLIATLISSVFIIRRRREYSDMLRFAFSKGAKAEYSYAPFVLALMCGYIALINLF